MWIRLSRQKAETGPKSGGFEGSPSQSPFEGSPMSTNVYGMSTNVYWRFPNVYVYHVSIMGLSCTYHVTGTMGVYPAPITCRNPSATVGNRRHGDYVGNHWNSDHVGTHSVKGTMWAPVCTLDYVGTDRRRHMSMQTFQCVGHNVVGIVFVTWTTSAPTGAEVLCVEDFLTPRELLRYSVYV